MWHFIKHSFWASWPSMGSTAKPFNPSWDMVDRKYYFMSFILLNASSPQPQSQAETGTCTAGRTGLHKCSVVPYKYYIHSHKYVFWQIIQEGFWALPLQLTQCSMVFAAFLSELWAWTPKFCGWTIGRIYDFYNFISLLNGLPLNNKWELLLSDRVSAS